jgi:hypothetical protein
MRTRSAIGKIQLDRPPTQELSRLPEKGVLWASSSSTSFGSSTRTVRKVFDSGGPEPLYVPVMVWGPILSPVPFPPGPAV